MENLKASELRIGNYLQGEPFSCQRIGYGDGVIQIMAGGILGVEQGHLNYKPIPLAEEWLVKFKYKYSNKGRCWVSPNGFKLWNCGTKKKPEFYHLNSELLITFDYVHYLQNVEFDLTGEELTIKE